MEPSRRRTPPSSIGDPPARSRDDLRLQQSDDEVREEPDGDEATDVIKKRHEGLLQTLAEPDERPRESEEAHGHGDEEHVQDQAHGVTLHNDASGSRRKDAVKNGADDVNVASNDPIPMSRGRDRHRFRCNDASVARI